MKHSEIGIISIALLFLGCSTPVTGLGKNGLNPCPDKPNCVSSLEKTEQHTIEPLPYSSDKAAAKERLIEIIGQQERATIVQDTPDYIHVAFKTKWMRFTDDVEFWFPDNESVIHVRSASRTGYSDFGVNRKRVETIRSLFIKKAASN